jgi:hypothetical protein
VNALRARAMRYLVAEEAARKFEPIATLAEADLLVVG